MKAKSIQGKSVEEVSQLLETITIEGFNPTLAFVFISAKQNIKAISEILEKNRIAIIGATTAGEFTDNGVEKDSISILLLEMNPKSFTIAFATYEIGTALKVTGEIGKKGIEKFTNPGFIICGSGIYQEGKEIADGILEGSATEVLIGGMAGDDSYVKTTVFSNGFESDSGIVALIIDLDKVLVKGHAVSGWKPVGIEKTVTKSKDNWILEIDNQPALDVLSKFLGVKITSETTDEQMRDATVTFPFELYLESNRSILVPPIAFNPETKGIMVPRGIEEGLKLKFTMPPDLDVVDRVVESAKTVKNESFADADAMIIFSCIGRLLTLGPLVNEEIEGLNEVWNTPMAGFFSYGEFGAAPGEKPGFVGTTYSWVVLKEK